MAQAVAFIGEGRMDEAKAICEQVLDGDGDNVDAIYAMGWIAFSQQDHETALARFRRVIEFKPEHARAHNNIGMILMIARDAEAAARHFERAVAHELPLREAHANLGAALLFQRKYGAAREVLQKAVDLVPDDPDMLNNLADIKLRLGEADDAIADYQRVVSLQPDLAKAHIRLAHVLRSEGKIEDALASLKRAQEVDPDHPYLRGQLLSVKMYLCDWESFTEDVDAVVEKVQAGDRAIEPFSFMGLSDSSEEQLKCARIFATDRYPAARQSIWRGERYLHERIRVAYVSADFHAHPLAFLMTGMLEHHDRSRFEIFGISFGPDRPSKIRTRLENAVDRFISVPHKDDRELALLIRELEIDIAVDRKGYTQACRTGVFALRPAPVQVNYLAYPGTMGVGYIDYIIGDRWVIPEEQEENFTEKVVCLPHTYQANDSKRPISPTVPSRMEEGLPETGFVFCSFAANWKITPAVFDIWMRLLGQVEGSVLWLIDCAEAPSRNLRAEAERRGVSPDRMIFAPRVGNDKHLARHGLAGLCLDTSPYGAHTTASDALYVGVPIVTCLGQTFTARVTASVLHAAGMPELVTGTFGEYEALALELARDENALAAVKTRLEQNIKTHPLYDTELYCRHLESAYETMWARYQRGEPPESFSVPAD